MDTIKQNKLCFIIAEKEIALECFFRNKIDCFFISWLCLSEKHPLDTFHIENRLVSIDFHWTVLGMLLMVFNIRDWRVRFCSYVDTGWTWRFVSMRCEYLAHGVNAVTPLRSFWTNLMMLNVSQDIIRCYNLFTCNCGIQTVHKQNRFCPINPGICSNRMKGPWIVLKVCPPQFPQVFLRLSCGGQWSRRAFSYSGGRSVWTWDFFGVSCETDEIIVSFDGWCDDPWLPSRNTLGELLN